MTVRNQIRKQGESVKCAIGFSAAFVAIVWMAFAMLNARARIEDEMRYALEREQHLSARIDRLAGVIEDLDRQLAPMAGSWPSLVAGVTGHIEADAIVDRKALDVQRLYAAELDRLNDLVALSITNRAPSPSAHVRLRAERQ